MPAPVIAAIIAGGASVGAAGIGAKLASNASKNAAATQAASGQQALGLQRDQWQAQQARTQPYVQAGQQSAQRLSDLLSPGRMGQYPPFTPGGAPSTQPPMFGAPPSSGMAQPQARPLSAWAQPQTGGGLVTMEAPDGERKQVPASQQAYWQAKGAKVVS